jgi:hypothetical protein
MVWDDVQPELIGPYENENARNRKARDLKSEYIDDHGILGAELDGDDLKVYNWSSAFFYEKDG